MSESQALPGHDFGLAASRFHRARRHAVETALQPFALSGTEYGALVFVDRNPGTSNADLARFLFITPQALGRLTAQLHARGLLVRHADEAVGRRRPLALTSAGTRAVREAEPAVERAQQELLRPLTTVEQLAFLHALDACTPFLESPRKDLT